jgi:hypothetical protein
MADANGVTSVVSVKYKRMQNQKKSEGFVGPHSVIY